MTWEWLVEMAEPSPGGAEARMTYTYNCQGQRTSLRDQNGKVHEYAYDGLGRQTADSVITVV